MKLFTWDQTFSIQSAPGSIMSFCFRAEVGIWSSQLDRKGTDEWGTGTELTIDIPTNMIQRRWISSLVRIISYVTGSLSEWTTYTVQSPLQCDNYWEHHLPICDIKLEVHMSHIKLWQTWIWNWFGWFIGQEEQEGITVAKREERSLPGS